MTRYLILERSTPLDLEREVNESLQEGWELQGGISTYHDSRAGRAYYTQAIIKHEAEDEGTDTPRE